MKKIIAYLFITLSVGVFANAQGGFGPVAGNISVSMQLGRAESFNNLQSCNSLINTNGTYTLYAPSASSVSSSGNDLVNMIGVEAKYFITSQIAIRLSGMGIIDLTPSQDAVEGLSTTLYSESTTGIDQQIIPSYSSIESRNTHKFIVNLGGDYYFNVSAKRVHPYVGVMASLNYGRGQYFNANNTYTSTSGTSIPQIELGSRFSETYGLGGSLVGGIDYYVAEGMFIGLEIKPVSYMYSVSTLIPVAGVEAYDADNHNLGFLTNPMFKIGFTF